MTKQLLSVIETPIHPDFSQLYQAKGYAHSRVNSMRKAISHVKKNPVDLVVAEFLFGYGDDYAGITVSNVDVLLYSLQRYRPDTEIILLVDKSERQYLSKLPESFVIKATLVHPVAADELSSWL
jgi:hypothetical protein